MLLRAKPTARKTATTRRETVAKPRVVAPPRTHPISHAASGDINRLDHTAVMKIREKKLKRYLETWRNDIDPAEAEKMNIMKILVLVAFGTPLLGLGFAALTYGTLWGMMPGTGVLL